ncbi:MAG: 3-phytase, partial [Flavitalea sp.]
MLKNIAFVFSAYVLLSSCGGEDAPPPPPAADALKPAVTTEKAYDYTDDPAIWINKADPDRS